MWAWFKATFSATDSRGNRSTTLGFCAISFTVLLFKFALAGVHCGPLGVMPPMSPGEFGAALVVVLGIWRHREYTERVAKEAGNVRRDQ